jgi:hypothetical protein
VQLVEALEGRDVARAALLQKPGLLIPLFTREIGFGQKRLLLKRKDGRTILQRLGNWHLFSTSSTT